MAFLTQRLSRAGSVKEDSLDKFIKKRAKQVTRQRKVEIKTKNCNRYT